MNKKLAVLTISILAICACSSVLLLVFVVTSGPTFFAAPAPTDTLIILPQTPAVAVLEVPPTFTPLPTLIPISKSTSVPVTGNCLTPVEYASKVENLGKGWEAALNDFAGLMDKAGSDANLISDPSWQAQVEIDLTKIDTVAYQVQALNAPRGLKAVDTQLKAAASEALSFSSDVRNGIHTMDSASLTKAVTHMNNFNDIMKKATAEIQKASTDDTCE